MKKREKEAENLRILVVKTSSLGDILQCFCVVRYLNDYFPSVVIDWVVEEEYKDLLVAHPQIERVIPVATRRWRRSLFSKRTKREWMDMLVELRKRRYDCLFDLQGTVKSALLTKCAHSKEKVGFSWSAIPEWPAAWVLSHRYVDGKRENSTRLDHYLSVVEQHMGVLVEPTERREELSFVNLKVTQEEKKQVDHFVQKGSLPLFMVCIGSSWENKKLHHKSWMDFLHRILQAIDSSFVFCVGSEEEKREAASIAAIFGEKGKLLPTLSLPSWQYAMQKMDALISVDSSALHLCRTTHTPSFGIFGPSSANCYQRIEKSREGALPTFRGAFQGKCPYHLSFHTRCKRLRSCPTGDCVKKIDVDALFRDFLQFWKAHDRSI